MKTKQNLMLLLLLLLGVITGCKKNVIPPNCEGGSVSVPLTELAEDMDQVNCALQGIDEAQQTVNLIIKSQADYVKYVKCGGAVPAIDFSKYFLLAGRTILFNCGRVKAQSLVLQCDEIEYIVETERELCNMMMTRVSYFTLVPRQYVNIPVVFTIKRE